MASAPRYMDVGPLYTYFWGSTGSIVQEAFVELAINQHSKHVLSL